MLTQSKLKSLFITGALALSMASVPALATAEKAATNVASPTKQVEQSNHDKVSEKRKKIIAEATSAIRETQNALKALDNNKPKEALAALERALGKLEIVVARDPKLALAPAGVNAFTHDVIGTVDDIKKIKEKAEEALDEGRLQEARRLISGLASEIVIRTSNIPLASYPDAMKKAVKLIDEDKIKEAKVVLQTALSTLVITETIIPIPIVTAEELLKRAEVLAEKQGRKEAENKALEQLLKAAREELKFAQALGYGTEQDFKDLYKHLDEIEVKTKGGKFGKGFFDKIKTALGLTKEHSQAPKPAEAAPQSATKK